MRNCNSGQFRNYINCILALKCHYCEAEFPKSCVYFVRFYFDKTAHKVGCSIYKQHAILADRWLPQSSDYILHVDQSKGFCIIKLCLDGEAISRITTNNNRDVKVRFDWPLSCNVGIKSSYINFQGDSMDQRTGLINKK